MPVIPGRRYLIFRRLLCLALIFSSGDSFDCVSLLLFTALQFTINFSC